MEWPLNSTCYPRQEPAAERSMSWMVTQLYCDIACLVTRSRWATRLCATGWGGLGPRDQEKHARRAPLRGYVLIDCNSSQSHCVNIQNTKTQLDSSSFGTSLSRQTRGGQRGFRRLGPVCNAEHSAWPFAAQDHNNNNSNNNSWSWRFLEPLHAQRNPFFSHGKTASICELHS